MQLKGLKKSTFKGFEQVTQDVQCLRSHNIRFFCTLTIKSQ